MTTTHDIPDDELTAYVLGTLAGDQFQTMDAHAADNEEFAAEIAIRRLMAGVSIDDDPALPLRAVAKGATPSAPRTPLRSWRKVAIAAAVFLAISGIGWGGWRLMNAQGILFSDTFETGWLDHKKWKTGRRMTTAQDGYARLNDRGSLVTVQEFKDPFVLELDWRWIDISGDIHYRDTLTIAMHSSGEHVATHPFRVRDGVEVVLQTHSGRLAVECLNKPQSYGETQEGALPMPAGKWHHVRIVEDGKTIAVYLSGPGIDQKYQHKPVLTVPYKGNFERHHIAIYNREPVAGALHESHIRNVVIRALPHVKSE